MKNFLAGCSLGVLISALGFVVLDRDVPIGSSVAELPNAPALTNAQQQKLWRLEQENTQLKLALKNRLQSDMASAAISAHGKHDAGGDKKPVTEAEVTAKVYAQHFDQLQRAADFSRYTNNLEARGQTMFNDLAEKFSSEPVDYSWAPDYQQKIAQIFAEVESLQKLVPGAIECRTSKCQIKIPVTGSDEANQMTAAFAAAIQDNQSGVAKTEVLATPDLSRGQLNLYIAKNNTFKVY